MYMLQKYKTQALEFDNNPYYESPRKLSLYTKCRLCPPTQDRVLEYFPRYDYNKPVQ